MKGRKTLKEIFISERKGKRKEIKKTFYFNFKIKKKKMRRHHHSIVKDTLINYEIMFKSSL